MRIISAGISTANKSWGIFTNEDRFSLFLFKRPVTINIDNVCYKPQPGSLCILVPGQKKQLDYNLKDHHLFVHFKFENMHPTYCFNGIHNTEIRFNYFEDTITRIIQVYEAHPEHAVLKLQDLLLEFDLLAEKKKGVIPGNHIPEVVFFAMNLINESLCKPLVISTIAERCEISHRHLSRLFKKHVGMTLIEYVQKQRLEKAVFYLQASDLSIKEIANEVGIPDLHMFNKKIRNVYKLAPRRLRVQLQGDKYIL